MRKLFSLLLMTVIILAACNSSELNISEIQSIPTNVQEKINTDYTLQLLEDSEEGDSYIVFHSLETVKAQLELKENILIIKLDSITQENSELKPHVYKITRGDAEYDTINVLINGQATPLDSVSAF